MRNLDVGRVGIVGADRIGSLVANGLWSGDEGYVAPSTKLRNLNSRLCSKWKGIVYEYQIGSYNKIFWGENRAAGFFS